MNERNRGAAEAAREIARDIAGTVYSKQLAYGDSGRIANGLWEARLAQYLTEDGESYLIPRGLMRHIPRITRLDDRINRIISNPDGDLMGEDPWRDAAGDCVVGALNAETSRGLRPGSDRTGESKDGGRLSGEAIAAGERRAFAPRRPGEEAGPPSREELLERAGRVGRLDWEGDPLGEDPVETAAAEELRRDRASPVHELR